MTDNVESLSYDDFLKRACKAFDLNWRKYRRRATRRNLEERIRRLGLAGYANYLERLRNDPGEADHLPDVLRVTVSRFMRERERWETLRNSILPLLLSGRSSSAPFRAWSAGCCGGEEPYTLSLVWLDQPPSDRPLKVLATDIDEDALLRGRTGCYETNSLRELREPLVQKGFRLQGGKWCVREEVRSPVVFRNQNLRADPLPENMDLILCRYFVFTYYRGYRRHEGAERLWKALRPGGVLMIGKKEGLGPGERQEFFTPWPGLEGFYVRKELKTVPPPLGSAAGMVGQTPQPGL